MVVKFFRSAASNCPTFASEFTNAHTEEKYVSHAVLRFPLASWKSDGLAPNTYRCGTDSASVASCAFVNARAAASVNGMTSAISLIPDLRAVRVRFTKGTTGTTPRLWMFRSTSAHTYPVFSEYSIHTVSFGKYRVPYSAIGLPINAGNVRNRNAALIARVLGSLFATISNGDSTVTIGVSGSFSFAPTHK